MIKDLYFIFGSNQIWLNPLKDDNFYKQKFLKRNNNHHLCDIYWHLHFRVKSFIIEIPHMHYTPNFR